MVKYVSYFSKKKTKTKKKKKKKKNNRHTLLGDNLHEMSKSIFWESIYLMSVELAYRLVKVQICCKLGHINRERIFAHILNAYIYM